MNLTKLTITTLLMALPTLAIAKPNHGERTREQTRELLGEVKDKNPEKFERLMELRRTDPEAFHHAMRKVKQHYRGGIDHDDPAMRAEKEKMRELRRDVRDVLEAYQAADDSEKPKLRKELEALAADVFDARQAHREMRLDKIRDHVEELEAEIKERASNRDALIEAWIEEKTNPGPRGL